jgi:glycogen debranching enzyme
MPLAVGDRTILFSGYTVAATAPDGETADALDGLFHRDTRVLSDYRLTVDGRSPELVAHAHQGSDDWLAAYRVPRAGGTPDGPMLPQDVLEILVRRRVGRGMLDELRVRNDSSQPLRATIRVEIDADFRDVAEIGGDRLHEGNVTRSVAGGGDTLEIRSCASRDGREAWRGLRVRAEGDTPAVADEQGLSWTLDLPARETWTATLHFGVLVDRDWIEPTADEFERRARQRAAWQQKRPSVVAPEQLRRPFERAAEDLFDLRNWELEDELLGASDGSRWIVNAGVPRFTGVFGRDVLTTGMQSALLGTRALRGAIDVLAARQATKDDPWRDAESGKLLHELRRGPLGELGINPRDAYYGSQTTPAIFVLALAELWHWTGDDDLVRPHLDVARRALDWARHDGDPDRDGEMEYERRSAAGLVNQAWKDSDEAIRHADGSQVRGPIATVEEQAFHIAALERMAELVIGLGEDDPAASYLEEASALRRVWQRDFWMPDAGFYALATDGAQRQVRSIASNPGHALAWGVVPSTVARQVADRLLEPDLFSGWGVRSLSSRHPSYNPFGYHLGTVWPIEQATFALGFKRYGLDEHVDRLIEGFLAAAFASRDARLAEAITGHDREAVPTPITYPEACSPQAWSASAVVQAVQAMLGLVPFGPMRVLGVVRPRLPAWLPQLTVRDVRVGRAVVDLRFDRRADGSASWRVLRLRGPLVVAPLAPANDLGRPRLTERATLAVIDRAPGRRGAAARLALRGGSAGDR